MVSAYLGTPIPWAEPTPSQAPLWAQYQRFSLQQIQQILDYWIDERQTEDGQFGGGWGDDVEMWRWWTPILLGFDLEKYQSAQQKLATNVFELERMQGGYTNILTDVEHSAEDSADTITPMLLLYPTDEQWQNRAKALVTLMDSVWTAENDLGNKQFQSTYFTHDQIHPSEEFACDTPYHARAIQPAVLLWQQTQQCLQDCLVMFQFLE